jgi:tetratricopeptide (TPR) repeat protein
MQRAATAIALIVLGCAACATVEQAPGEQAPGDSRLMEAQKLYEEGKKLREAGKYAEAMPLVERALELREAIHGGTHLEVASCLNLLGDVHQLRGSYTHAEPLYERALAIREASLGMNHPDVATSLNSLANLYRSQGLHAEAEPLYERALAIREAALGKSHPDVAKSLNNLALLYRTQGRHAKAEPLYERALAIWEATLGKNHPDTAVALNNLAMLYRDQGLYARAEPLYERALAIWEATLGKNHPNIATTLNNLAILYRDQGRYARARSLQERALAIREAALGKNHPDVATSLNNLAVLDWYQGRYARAEPLFEHSLAIREAALGKNHPDVAASLNDLAMLYRDQGRYARAEPLFEHSLAIREAALGKNHPDVATSIHNLATLYFDQGRYARAERLYERALAIREAALGKNHPHVADSLNSLASLYAVQGLYVQAEPLFERALAIQEAALGKSHPHVAASLNNLAALYEDQGLYSRSEPLYKRALAILEATLGENHPRVAFLLNNLALLYFIQGRYAQAEPLYERALAIWEAALGKNHPAVANQLSNLANLYFFQGLYARAEPLYERAIATGEATLNKSHPSVTSSLNNLARFRVAQQNLGEALPLFTRAFAASEAHLRQEALSFSEVRLAGLLHLLREDEERLYSLVRAHPGDARVRHLALSAALLRKGRSLEEIADTSRIIFRSLGQADREAFERLRALRTQYSALSLSGPGSLPPADYQQHLQELAAQADALEADLSRRSAPLRALSSLPAPAEVVDQVAKTLPKEGVLIEFIAFHDRPLVPTPGGAPSQSPSPLRYLALLLFADGRSRAIDFGPAEPINSAALRLHEALAGRAISYQPAAQALYQLAFRPLLPHLGKAQRLFLSPDSQLTLVPFAALHDGSRFLVDVLDITYLTSGKDLLPRPEGISAARSVVVLADPDFGAPPATPSGVPQSSPALAERSASLERFYSSRFAPSTDSPWPPLPGTRKEAETIHRLLPQAQLLLGPAATKQALLTLGTPGILHIATHGFFREDAATPTLAVSRVSALGEARPLQHSPDPLLRSGLVLAGASAQQAPSGPLLREETLITALELAGLDLWGTQLVVLSACDTGRGDIKLGQGVYGLRRALVIAGAEALVTSLWKVNDESTRQFMEAYYSKLLEGAGRTSALRQAMKEFRRKQPHPYYWAPFIALGRDGPLQGLSPPRR